MSDEPDDPMDIERCSPTSWSAAGLLIPPPTLRPVLALLLSSASDSGVLSGLVVKLSEAAGEVLGGMVLGVLGSTTGWKGRIVPFIQERTENETI